MTSHDWGTELDEDEAVCGLCQKGFGGSEAIATDGHLNRIDIFEIECSACQKWFHGRSGLWSYSASGPLPKKFDKYHPRVSTYCLLSMTGSYTDFHNDFGGVSFYFHVYQGQKVFYFAAPADENLAIYKEWQLIGDSTKDLMKLLPPGSVTRVVVNEGETMLIPGGWLHAVYTPVDTLVFGGSFLHKNRTTIQLKVFKIEQELQPVLELDDKYFYPHFEYVTLLAVKNIVIPDIQRANTIRKIDEHLIKSAMQYKNALTSWFIDKKTSDGLMNKLAQDVISKLEMLLRRQMKFSEVEPDVLDNNGKKRRVLMETDSIQMEQKTKLD